jgi:peptide/nickel transport system permease protein
MINEIEQEFAEAPEKASELSRLWRVFTGRGVVLFGMIVIIILILTAFFAPFIAPYDPYDQNL